MFDITKVDRKIEFFMFDIYIAILKIREVSSDFNDVENLFYDFRYWDSIIREFEIIGEASKYLLKDKLLTKDYQIVVDFRNQITHEYFGIDQDIVWATIHFDLKSYEIVILDLINNIKNDLRLNL